MAANTVPFGNGERVTKPMDIDDPPYIKVDDSGGKTLLLNSNSIGTVHPGNRQQGVTKIFTIAKASESNQFEGNGGAAHTVTISKSHIVNTGQSLANVVTVSPQKVITVPRTPPRQMGAMTKVVMSPVKSPGKVTMIPVSGLRSPHKIIQAGQVVSVSHASLQQSFVNSSKPLTVTSPTKMYVQRPVAPGSIQLRPQPAGVAGNVQPQTVQGNRFQYVRLVSASGPSQAAAGVRQIVPAKSILAPQPSSSTQQMQRIQPAIQPMQQQMVKTVTTSQSQRVILPNTSQVRGQMASIAPRPAQQQGALSLPPGATIIQQSPAGGQQNSMGSFALVPAQYVQQQMGTTARASVAAQSVIPKAIDTVPSARQQARQIPANGPSDGGTQRPRKPCNCTKSQCLKLYCDCFANGEFCHNCNCTNCFNNLEHEEERGKSIKQCLDRNPLAFKPKIGKGRNGESTDRRHNKGCNCKRSGCLKNYCECYEAKIMCSSLCKCVGCKNFEESPDRKPVNILSSNHDRDTSSASHSTSKATSRQSSSAQILNQPSRPAVVPAGERLPYSFVTDEVALATCMCLVAQAEEAERTRQSDVAQERMIIEEFGRCLMQVIDSANKTRHAADTDSIHSS